MGAGDRGYRGVAGHDALCSSSDATHDASLQLYHSRFGVQIEAVPVAEILAQWR